MPIHDWTLVEAGIFHHFHHGWIEEIARALNSGLLPEDYYALAEQVAAGLWPDVLTLQGLGNGNLGVQSSRGEGPAGIGLMTAPTKIALTGETDMAFYRRKQKAITVRHVSGDNVVAMVEVVSPGNKSGANALRAFVDKVAQLLEKGIHLLILDLHPPGRRDPQGIHGAIWEEVANQPYTLPPDKLLTLVSYERAAGIRAYVAHLTVGDVLTDMPLYLEPGGLVEVPLEATYQAAFAAVPRRWRSVLERPAPSANGGGPR